MYICSKGVFGCKPMYRYTIDLNVNHVNHSATCIPVCCTDMFVCKRTMYTIDLNLNHAHDRIRE